MNREIAPMKCQSLPPKVKGSLYGYLIMKIDEIKWCRIPVRDVLVLVSWWGGNCVTSFRPWNVKSDLIEKESDATVTYEVRTSQHLFKEYLKDCHSLTLTVVDESIQEPIGLSKVSDLPHIICQTFCQSYYPIINSFGNRIGDLQVGFSFQSIQLSNLDLTLNLNLLRHTDKMGPFYKSLRENVCEPRKSLKHKSKYETVLTKCKRKASLHSDSEIFMPVPTNTPESRVNIPDTVISHILEHGQKLRDAMVHSVLTDCNLPQFGCSTVDVQSSRGQNTLLEGSTTNNKILINYLLGEAMKPLEEKQALEALRSWSPTDSVLAVAEDVYNIDRLKYIGNEEPKMELKCMKGIPSHVQFHYSATTNSSDNSDSNELAQGQTIQTDIKHIQKQNGMKKSLKRRLESNLLVDKVNCLQVYVDKLELNSLGMKKVLAASATQGQSLCVPVSKRSQSKDVTQSRNIFKFPPGVTYFVEYEIPSHVTSPGNTRFGSKTHRFCSKKQAEQVIYFGKSLIHSIQNGKQFFDRMMSTRLIFKIFSRHLNQRVPLLLGETEFKMTDVMLSPRLSWALDLPIAFESRSKLILGTLALKIELGLDRVHFGSDLLRVVTQQKVEEEALDETEMSKEEEVSLNFFSNSSGQRKKLPNENKTCSVLGDTSNAVSKINELPISCNNILAPTLLYGFLHISEGREFEIINSYLVCRAFWKEDVVQSDVCWSTDNPHYNFHKLIPVLLNLDLLERSRNNFLIIEVWEQLSLHPDNLLGIVKLSLNQFYVVYKDSKVASQLLLAKYPVIAVDGWMTVTSPITQLPCAQLHVILALGTEDQIQLLKTTRGLNSNIILPNTMCQTSNPSHTSIPSVNNDIISKSNQMPITPLHSNQQHLVEPTNCKDSALEMQQFHRINEQVYLHGENSSREHRHLPQNVHNVMFIEPNLQTGRSRQMSFNSEPNIGRMKNGVILLNSRDVSKEYQLPCSMNCEQVQLPVQPCLIQKHGDVGTNVLCTHLKPVLEQESQKEWINCPSKLPVGVGSPLNGDPSLQTNLTNFASTDGGSQHPVSVTETSWTQSVPLVTSSDVQFEISKYIETVSVTDDLPNISLQKAQDRTTCEEPEVPQEMTAELLDRPRDCNDGETQLSPSIQAESRLLDSPTSVQLPGSLIHNVSSTAEENVQLSKSVLQIETPQIDKFIQDSTYQNSILDEYFSEDNIAMSVKQSEINHLSNYFLAHIEIIRALHLPLDSSRKDASAGLEPSTYVSFQALEEFAPRTHDSWGKELIVTPVALCTGSPAWNWCRNVQLPADVLTDDHKRLTLKVWQKVDATSMVPNPVHDTVLGFASVDLTVLMFGLPSVRGWFNIVDRTGLSRGEIEICVIPMDGRSQSRSGEGFDQHGCACLQKGCSKNRAMRLTHQIHADKPGFIIHQTLLSDCNQQTDTSCPSMSNPKIHVIQTCEPQHEQKINVLKPSKSVLSKVNNFKYCSLNKVSAVNDVTLGRKTPHQYSCNIPSMLNGCDLDDLQDVTSSFLSRTLKQKLSELDEITQRLKQRLECVTKEDVEDGSALNGNLGCPVPQASSSKVYTCDKTNVNACGSCHILPELDSGTRGRVSYVRTKLKDNEREKTVVPLDETNSVLCNSKLKHNDVKLTRGGNLHSAQNQHRDGTTTHFKENYAVVPNSNCHNRRVKKHLSHIKKLHKYHNLSCAHAAHNRDYNNSNCRQNVSKVNPEMTRQKLLSIERSSCQKHRNPISKSALKSEDVDIDLESLHIDDNEEDGVKEFDAMTDYLMETAMTEVELENVFNPLLFQHLLSAYITDASIQRNGLVRNLPQGDSKKTARTLNIEEIQLCGNSENDESASDMKTNDALVYTGLKRNKTSNEMNHAKRTGDISLSKNCSTSQNEHPSVDVCKSRLAPSGISIQETSRGAEIMIKPTQENISRCSQSKEGADSSSYCNHQVPEEKCLSSTSSMSSCALSTYLIKDASRTNSEGEVSPEGDIAPINGDEETSRTYTIHESTRFPRDDKGDESSLDSLEDVVSRQTPVGGNPSEEKPNIVEF